MYDESKPEPITAHDTENHTKFYWNDKNCNYPATYRLDGSRKFVNHYHRLFRHNRGVNGKWIKKDARRKRDNLIALDAIVSQLELPELHHRVARMELERAPLSKWSTPNGIDVYLVSIMICAVICLRDPRLNRPYHPDRNDESQDELFLRLMNHLQYRQSDVRSCYQKVLKHVNWGPIHCGEKRTA